MKVLKRTISLHLSQCPVVLASACSNSSFWACSSSISCFVLACVPKQHWRYFILWTLRSTYRASVFTRAAFLYLYGPGRVLFTNFCIVTSKTPCVACFLPQTPASMAVSASTGRESRDASIHDREDARLPSHTSHIKQYTVLDCI